MIDQWSDDRRGWARFSDDMLMRYRLARSLVELPLAVSADGVVGIEGWHGPARCVTFTLLNPSVADAFQLDPTVKRCEGFAIALGADVYQIANANALRSTDPGGLYKRAYGYRGDDQVASDELLRACIGAVRVIAGWGKHGALDHRGDVVRSMLRHAGVRLYHLGLNRDGSPKHPLYLRGGTEPQEWTV